MVNAQKHKKPTFCYHNLYLFTKIQHFLEKVKHLLNIIYIKADIIEKYSQKCPLYEK